MNNMPADALGIEVSQEIFNSDELRVQEQHEQEQRDRGEVIARNMAFLDYQIVVGMERTKNVLGENTSDVVLKALQERLEEARHNCRIRLSSPDYCDRLEKSALGGCDECLRQTFPGYVGSVSQG